jgi:dTDP-4-dehydrorhamnose reductase
MILDASSPSALAAAFEKERPGAVFLCSYSRSDRALTVDAARQAARLAARHGARFVFFSTDMVFDGRQGAYTEDALVDPIVPYGALKAEAEAQVRVENPEALIVRTSLLVGESGIMLRPEYECGHMMRGQPALLYADEWRSPTHVDDVARAAWELVSTDVAGLFHVAGPERLSRLELGRILCTMFRFSSALVKEGPRPADRPRDTSLDSGKAASFLGWAPAPMRTPVAAGV